MLTDEGTSSQREEVLIRTRALRDEYARAAALYAYRIERARGMAQVGELARWTAEYRRLVAKCRVLGEIIRGERDADGLQDSAFPPSGAASYDATRE